MLLVLQFNHSTIFDEVPLPSTSFKILYLNSYFSEHKKKILKKSVLRLLSQKGPQKYLSKSAKFSGNPNEQKKKNQPGFCFMLRLESIIMENYYGICLKTLLYFS